MKWRNSKRTILAQISALSNSELFDRTLADAQGDDYEGAFTAEGGFRYDAEVTELTRRLQASGFLPPEYGKEL